MTMTPAKLPGLTDHLPRWIPRSLDELHGPHEGVVDLPIDLCWSGRTRYDVGSFRQRVSLYELVMIQGLGHHYPEFLNAEHLVDAWPFLHARVAPDYVQAWEDRFPELARLGADREAVEHAIARWRAAAW